MIRKWPYTAPNRDVLYPFTAERASGNLLVVQDMQPNKSLRSAVYRYSIVQNFVPSQLSCKNRLYLPRTLISKRSTADYCPIIVTATAPIICQGFVTDLSITTVFIQAIIDSFWNESPSLADNWMLKNTSEFNSGRCPLSDGFSILAPISRLMMQMIKFFFQIISLCHFPLHCSHYFIE